MKRLNFKDAITNKFGNMFSFEKTNYINNKTKVILTCKKHGDQTYLPGNILRDNHKGCKHCNGTKTKEDFIAEAKALFGDYYDYSQINFVNVSTPVTIRCPKHGDFTQIPLRHLKGKKCMGCFREGKRLDFDSFEQRAKKIHGDKLVFYRHTWVSGMHPVTASCQKHGVFTARASSFLAGTGCKKCADEKQRKGHEALICDLKRIHGDRYDFSQVVYKGNKKKITLICPDHGPFERTPNGMLNTHGGCPTCKESVGERRIRRFLEESKIPFEREYKLQGFNYRWDFYLTELDVFVEYHGIQHYTPVEKFGGKAAFDAMQKRDRAKKRIVTERGSRQITISCLSKSLPETILKKRLKSLKLI